MDVNPLHFISFMLSTTLAFFSTALVVHCLIYYLKIKNYRTRYLMRLLPFMSVFCDFFALGNSISNWLNPLSCSSCVQKVFLGIFFPDKEKICINQISIMDYIHYGLGLLLMLAFGCFLAYLICKTIIQFASAHRYVKQLTKQSILYDRPLVNTKLHAAIQHHQTRIYLNTDIHVPMATAYNEIILPAKIKEFEQEEYEAVVAHEWEHLLWKDPQIKILIQIFKILLWWIPLKGWMKKIEEEQELAADQGILKHSFSEESLASALLKVAKHVNEKKLINVCHLVKDENSILKRIKALFNRYPNDHFPLIGTLLIIGALILFICCKLM